VELAMALHQTGVDVLVARLPTYYALDGQEQQIYFEALVDRSPGPLMLYNISNTTHMTIPLEVVEALSHSPKVVGIKDSDSNLPRLQDLLDRLGSRQDFSILVGVTSLSAQALALGADGLVPSAGNLVPGLCQELYASGIKAESTAAEDCQRRLDGLGALLRDGYSLAQSLGRLKAAMGALSLCDAYVLPPLLTPSAAQQSDVRHEFLEWQSQSEWSGE
jgi:4-hydroxy-tetrahydrodipicolinate synthase